MKKYLIYHVLADISVAAVLLILKDCKKREKQMKEINATLNSISYEVEFVEEHLRVLKKQLIEKNPEV